MHVRAGDVRRSHLHVTALEPLHKLRQFGVTSQAYQIQELLQCKITVTLSLPVVIS